MEEISSEESIHLISKLNSSLADQEQDIRLITGTLAFQIYMQDIVLEKFNCSYGLNETYRSKFVAGGLKISGVGQNGEVRIIELLNHPFFLATLYLPQLSSTPEKPHPMITAFLNAVK